MFPGGGVAAQLAMRAIKFGSEAAAIGLVQAPMETFLPHGSTLGDPTRSWLGRLAHGASNVRPALPNTAGQNQVPMQPQPQPGGPTPPGQPGVGGAASAPLIGEMHVQSPASPEQIANEVDRHAVANGYNAYGAGSGR
jgi:hypothetical protein